MATESPEAAQHVGHVAAEDAAIGVQLVDDDVAEVLEQHRPLRVMGQDPRVHHVGIGQHQVGARPHGPPGILRRVAIVGEHSQFRKGLRDLFQLGELVLGQGLGRKEIEHACVGLPEQRLKHGQVVAERLARRRRRDDDDVVALLDQLPRLSLVGVELTDPACPKRIGEPGIDRRRKRNEDGWPRGKLPQCSDARPGRR